MKTTDPKMINSRSLYNFLQDGQHLILLDFRPRNSFVKKFIRKSYNYDLLESEPKDAEALLTYFKQVSKNALINEEKYKLQKMRRIVFIIEEGKIDSEQAMQLIKNSNLFEEFDRKYVMKNHLDNFFAKYPFLSIEIPESQSHLSFSEIQTFLVDEKSSDLLYANASFPFEVIEDSVFLGKSFHGDNGKLLADLKIGFCVEVQKVEKGTGTLLPIENQPDKYLIQIDIDAIIDFDSISNEIDEKRKGKAVLFVGKDLDLPSGLAIAYIMKSSKVPINVASLKVFSCIGQTTVDRLLYNQIMHYEPGKLVFVKV